MSEGHRSGVSELYVFSRPKHYKEGPVRRASFAASDNRQRRSHPGKRAFHRTKLSLDASRPAKLSFPDFG